MPKDEARSERERVIVVCSHPVIRELIQGAGQWVCQQCRVDVSLILANLPNAKRMEPVVSFVLKGDRNVEQSAR